MTFTPHSRLFGNVIALSGHDGSGKTTTARILAEDLGGVVLSLADALKAQAASHLSIPEAHMRAKPTPEHLRAFMRAYGWAMRQEHGLDYWLRRWEDRALTYDCPVIVDDVRHVNEADFLLQGGARLVCLERPETDPEEHGEHPPIIREVFTIRHAARARQWGGHARVVTVTGLTPRQVAALV